MIDQATGIAQRLVDAGAVKIGREEDVRRIVGRALVKEVRAKAGTVVKMFMPQFAPLVRSGAKLQTCRPTPKRMPKVGQRISLRQWAGKPYRSKQVVLRESVITQVQSIWFNGVTIILGDPKSGPVLAGDDARDFAQADGFENLRAMGQWFAEQHGTDKPFVGIVIKWRAD